DLERAFCGGPEPLGNRAVGRVPDQQPLCPSVLSHRTPDQARPEWRGERKACEPGRQAAHEAAAGDEVRATSAFEGAHDHDPSHQGTNESERAWSSAT